MATYKELLYSVGGGVISNAQRDAQNGSATIAIGLGGTGKDAIKRLKKEIYQRIAPDNEGEAVASYRHIKYLSIDTDTADLKNEEDFIGIDSNSEFFSIQGDTKIFSDESLRENRPYAKWLTGGIELLSDKGAGGVRQIGRYFLIEKSVALKNKLQQIFTAAVLELPSNDVNIHIMTGLGGGTGAGTFLDVCYLVQKAVNECQALKGKKVNISGYFFMPDVNLSRIGDSGTRDYVMYNSFAAMKELDYCMSLTENGDKWSQQYNGFEIETAQPPVKIAYLVSSQAVNGRVNENGYEYAMGVVSDYVVQFIADNDINMETHISNIAKKTGDFSKPHGGNYKYVIIGASHSIVPMREISTYLASKLFEKMAAAWSNEPTDEDIAQFCAKIGLSCDALIRNVGGYNINVPVVDNVYDKFSTDDTGDKYAYGYKLPEKILAPFDKQESKIRGETFKKGCDALVNEWKYGMDLNDAPISIVCRVYKALDEVVRDPKRGPLYAAKMLFGSDKKNIVNVISGILDTAKIRKDDAFLQIDGSIKGVKAARTAYNNRSKIDLGGGKKNKLFQDLLNAIKIDIGRRCEYSRYALLCEALDTAKTQLLDLYEGFFAKYADVILDLQKVFEANKQAIAALKDVSSDPFTLPLFKLSEVRNTLDAEVDQLGIDTVIEEFNNAFYRDAYEIWHTGNENEISRWISKYMSEAFRQYIELSLDDHIRNLYPDLAEDDLVKRVREDVIQKLDAMASELFLLDGAKAPRVQNHTDTLTYCSAPMTAPIVNRAIEEYRANKEGITHVSGSKNRIFFLKSSPFIPLYAYGLIDKCYDKYEDAASVTGKHLYEGASANGDPRNWQTMLPNLRPYSIYQHIDWTTPDKQATAEAYGEAENVFGVIHPEIDSTGETTGDYYIWKTPDYMSRIEEAKRLADCAQTLVDAAATTEDDKELLEKLEAISSQLSAERTNLKSYKEGLIDYKQTYSYDAVNNKQRLIKPEVQPVSIRNDGDKSTQATAFNVRRDYVLASPVLMNVVKEELAKVKAYNAAMQEMESVLDRLKTIIDEIETKIRNRETE